MTITLAALEAPDSVETLDYEDILQRMLQDLQARDPEFEQLLESDPAMKVLEVAAWRELLLRQRVNDATRSNLLAFAGGTDLEHLAAFYGVARLQAEYAAPDRPGEDGALLAEREDDEALRRRIQEKIAGWSTAGSRAHYRFHALSADVRVRDARADSPDPGRVRVAVLSHEGDGSPSGVVLDNVRSRVSADDVRVLTDTVEIVACEIVQVDVVADVYLYPDAPASLVEDVRSNFLRALDESRGLGWDLTRSWMIAHLFKEGVQRVELHMPEDTIILAENACIALRSLTLNLAGRDR